MVIWVFLHEYISKKKSIIFAAYKDKDDKDKDEFIGPKEFVSHLMMIQIKDILIEVQILI